MSDLRIVVPNHNRRDLVTRLVGFLLAQEGPAKAEIVIVCDGCTDGSAVHLRRTFGSSIAVIERTQGGCGPARNTGAEGCGAPYVMFLDDDMRPEPDLVLRHVEAQRRIGGGIVVGAIPVDPASPPSFLTEGLTRWAERRDARLRERPTLEFSDVLGGHMSVSCEMFERLGGFDPAFGSDEDLEFGWRALAAGARAEYAADAVAWQLFEKSFVGLARDIVRAAAADAQFVRKHPGVREHLLLDRWDRLPRWERVALRTTLRFPGTSRLALRPAILAMEQLRRRGAKGEKLEHAHAILRAHLYGLGISHGGREIVGP
jgi:glycosyltransferase involved in cell wall biosynthesis